jgi:hypothetical protein
MCSNDWHYTKKATNRFLTCVCALGVCLYCVNLLIIHSVHKNKQIANYGQKYSLET